MANEITFAASEKLLSALGFTPYPTTGSQRVFQYPPLGTMVVLPDYRHQSFIQPIHLVAVRKILIENGLITPAAFDGFLEKVNA